MTLTLQFLSIFSIVYTSCFSLQARIVTGKVVRENGKPVSAVVVIDERTSTFSLGRMERRLAVVKADPEGQFKLLVPDDAQVARLRVGACGVMKRAVLNDGTEGKIGTSVVLEHVSLRKPNIIVVPNDFAPTGDEAISVIQKQIANDSKASKH